MPALMKASTYITIYYGNGIHVLSRCMDNVQPRTPSVWMECILASHIRYVACSRIKHVAATQLINRRENGIRGMDSSMNPRNSREALRHTYKTCGSSSLVVQESKSDIINVLEVSKINHRLISHLKEPKIPSRASRSSLSLTDQCVLENQTILANFIQKPVIKVINYSLVHIIALIPTVTTRLGKYRTIG
jgi:hypothetical protein